MMTNNEAWPDYGVRFLTLDQVETIRRLGLFGRVLPDACPECGKNDDLGNANSLVFALPKNVELLWANDASMAHWDADYACEAGHRWGRTWDVDGGVSEGEPRYRLLCDDISYARPHSNSDAADACVVKLRKMIARFGGVLPVDFKHHHTQRLGWKSTINDCVKWSKSAAEISFQNRGDDALSTDYTKNDVRRLLLIIALLMHDVPGWRSEEVE